MPISNCYQTQPDGYVRFDWRGKPMEGEFYRYESFGAEIDPKLGYIRPFDKALRQQLVDNLQVTQKIDLLKYLAKNDLITCDAFVTSKNIQASYQIVIDHFDFINEDKLVSDKETISHCRADLLQRQYVFGSNLNESKEVLSSINAEYLKWVTPFCTPLRYERTWFIRNRERILRYAAIVILAVMAYIYFS
ncbi:hypothetical protein [Yersinia intermedia]|uniref:Uncharacterized protein n=1 Tax=Yersinia intermedia TaxID=631 RepID=A0A0T9MAB2_YERIN|nr:hypothetical protein [Yersinia intermedia]MCB5299794.1 hypothetical protein [Yersinia intermedia]MCW8112955.1 hypothetical protein [Yersinia intermedia]MDA5483296.1 hypothetical protein [Yersinia intermedia]MDA5491650.1 hypothetical protein [Yersinia intermedia]MDA5517876.1 hypothetical protein [Yersinia intermedia]